MEYKIIQLDNSHLEELLSLSTNKDERKNINKHLASSQGFIFGFFLENELIGYSKYWYCDLQDPLIQKIGIIKSEIKKTIYLNGTYVNPSNRGHNVQRKIHATVIPILKYYGIKHIICLIPIGNMASKKNISELGFKETIKEKNNVLYIRHI